MKKITIIIGLCLLITPWVTQAQTHAGDVLITGDIETEAVTPEILFTDTSGGSPFNTNDWSIGVNISTSPTFNLQDRTHNIFPWKIESMAPDNSFYMDFLGRIGLGTDSPEAALHVKREETGTLKCRVYIEATNAGTAVRKLLHLKNKGAARLEFENSDSGVKWILNPNAVDNFMITRIGSPGPDFVVKQNGDVTVRRNVTCVSLNQTSSRATKENFEPINKHEVLEKLADLEVEGWNYKTDPAQRHIGPMAEDFNKAFPGANSDKYINVGDATGALIASVQSLKEKNDAQAKLIDTLVERLSALETKLK